VLSVQIPHQTEGLLRPGVYYTFEWQRMPVSMTKPIKNLLNGGKVLLPHLGVLECWRRQLWIAVLIQRGEDVEDCEDVGDHQMQVSKPKVLSGTNPRSPIFNMAQRWTKTTCLPSPTAKDPDLRVFD
jgi:hypothetical protein